MSKQHFKSHNFRGVSDRLIEQADSILDEMAEEGYTLTLRQLYYQFVARDIIPNSEKSYKSLSKLITKAREAGLIAWDAIEDRNRAFKDYNYDEDINNVLYGLEGFIHYDLWARQDNYVEVWVEKDALVNVVERPAKRFRVPYMACKGYLSASHAWRAGQRFREKMEEGKDCVLIHLGDHDPSGLDMTRDNQDRLDLFAGYGVEVRRIALNIDQVRKYNPPPNPAKFEDPRANDYVRLHGKTSWELDALAPRVIDKMISDEIQSLITDEKSWAELQEQEAKDRARVSALPRVSKDVWKLVDKYLAKNK